MFSHGLSQNTLTPKCCSSGNWSSSNGREYFLIDLWLGSRTSKLRKCIHANGDTVSSVLRLLQEEFAWENESFTCLPHSPFWKNTITRHKATLLIIATWGVFTKRWSTTFSYIAFLWKLKLIKTLQIYCNLSRCEGQKQRGGLVIRHHKLAQKCTMRDTRAAQRGTLCFNDNSQVISNH